MASYNEEFNQYRIFLENIAKSVVPQESEVPLKDIHLRNRLSCHSDPEGEVIYWILKFLDEKKCPTKLIAPIVRNVLIEIQDDPQYIDPKGCPDFRGLAITVLEGFCIRLQDNVELNKILDTATSHSAQQQQNDDLLSIPIRTAAASQNKRRKMEDRSICIDEFHKVYAMKDPQKQSFYGVFDGHGGYRAAQYAASQLPFNLSQNLYIYARQIYALHGAFKDTDDRFKSTCLASGTTATCTLYRPDEGRLYIAWVGDSKAMLAKQQGKIMQLVTSHRPDLKKEIYRIRSSGGSIHHINGEYRVNGCLNVTRSIGDIQHKKFLISAPDCVIVDLDKTEEFLVLATDGLWDYVTEADIAKTVYDCIKEDCENIDQIPNRLIELAQARLSSDNILVVVVFFKQPSQIAKNCDNLTIMESQFDNIKEVEYYNSMNLYPSDENSTSNSHAIDAKQLRWSNDNLNNIINEEVKQTTTTTSSSNNGQFDDNLLYSSDNIDLLQKTALSPSDDNNMHHASTLENNGEEEQLLGASFDNKNLHEQLTTEEFDNEQQRIIEKNQPHQQQQLGDTDADYGPETCVDVTDDVVMMTENSADTNNLLEQSVLSHSKDTLPSSDNCNPFDNKNTLDMEDGNEFQLGSGGVDAQLHLDDANKSTPLLSPEMEDLPLSSEGGMQYTNEGFQQSPLDEDIPVEIGSHQEQVQFEEDFMPRNGHLSPVEMQHSEEEKLDVTQKAEEPESLSKLEEFEKVEEEKVNKEECSEKTGDDLSHQETDLDEEAYMGKRSESPVLQKENLYENAFSAENDEADFRSKDEEEILEKHVEPFFVEKEQSEVLDMNQRDELQQSVHNLEVDILEEKPILTGHILDNLSPLSTDEDKLNEFVEEKQDREEFSEKEDKVEDDSEKMIAVEQNGRNIELEEDECIHLEEDVRPSEYLAMVERQKLEMEQLEKEQEQSVKADQLVVDDNQLAEEGKLSLEQHTQEDLIGNYQQEQGMHSEFGTHSLEEDGSNERIEKLATARNFEKDERGMSDMEQFEDEKVVDGEDYKEHQYYIDEKFNDEVVEQKVEESPAVDEKFDVEHESYDEKFDQEEKEQHPVEKAEDKFVVEEDHYNEKFDQEEKEDLPVEKVDEAEKAQPPTEVVAEEPIEKAAEELEAVDEKADEVEKEPLPIENAPERLQDLVNELEIPAKELVEEICEQVEQVYSENNDLIEQADELEKEKQDKADEKLDKQVEQIDQNEHYDMDDSFTAATEQLEQQRHLNDIEIMSQQIDRFEKEDQAEEELQGDKQWSNVSEDSFTKQPQEEDKPTETANEEQKEDFETEQTQFPSLEDILNKPIDSFPTDNKYQSEEQPLSEEPSPVLDESIAQPEKQCFEEPEKNVEEILPQLDLDNLVRQAEEPIPSDTLPISPQPVEETENKFLEDPVDEIEKQLEEVNEKVLSKIENQILDLTAPLPKPRVSLDKPVQEYDDEPEELVEVEEPLIIKEQVPIKPSALSVTSQEPSAVPPTHESCDESEDDEWKYMKEGQGEKQLLGLQGDIVVEEDIQQPLQEEITEQQQPEAQLEQQPLETTATLAEEVIATASDQIETIKDTFESLTQNIADLAESAAEATETAVDKIGETLESLNLSQSSTREKLDNIEDDEDISASEMNSKLNPEAKEFVPTFSPTGPVDFTNGMSFGVPAATAIPHHFKDELIAQSPRKGRESNMENINIPAENEFDEEIAHKPHGLPGDEIITENVENGGLYQEMNWKEAMHGSEKEEGPLVDSPVTEESLEVVENVLQYGNAPNLCDFSAPVGLDNAGMKESIYIENNTSMQSNEEDVLNTVQVLPVETESQENSLEAENAVKEELISPANESAPATDVVTDNEVQEILTLAGTESKEQQIEENIEKRMEELLLSHDREITKDVPIEAEQVPINGVEMSPTEEAPSTPIEAAPVVAAMAMGTAAAVAVAATTTAVKKAEAEKNQKNLIKTSSATKSKVPDTKKPASATATKTAGSSATAAKRPLGDKPKPSATSSLATKKTSSTTTTAAPRPRTAPTTTAAKTIAEKKTTTTTTSTAKSRIDTKPPTTLASRKPLTSTATRTSASKPGDDAKSSSTTVKSSISGKPLVGSKTSVGSAKPLSAANSIAKTRPATASAAATTNGTATKTAASKPTTLAPKSAGHTKPSVTSPRGTLSSTLRKTEAIKSPVKTTASTITSRTSLSTNGTKTTTSTRTTTTTKTSLSSVPATAAKSTTGTTTTTRRTLTSTGTTSTVGATTPTSKTPNNLVSRKSTPLKKATTPAARKSIGSKLNASAAKPTKDTTTPRPVTIPPQHQNNNNSIVEAAPKAEIIPLVASNDINDTTVTLDNGEPKLNGVATPDDLTSPTAPVAQSLVEIA